MGVAIGKLLSLLGVVGIPALIIGVVFVLVFQATKKR